MSEEEYNKLISEGVKLFEKIGDDLNKYSDKFIRGKHTFRRGDDFAEICIALALLNRKIQNEILRSS